MRRQLEVPNHVAAVLAGSGDEMLRALEQQVDCDLFLRGNVVTLEGDAGAIAAASTVIRELETLVEQGHDVDPGTIGAVSSAIEHEVRPQTVLEDVVWSHRSKKVAPKTLNQKRYVDAVRSSTVTFGIGPAGTGKTFLAVAMAAAALSRKEVSRIILTRPAVEAGERLGFLPGDLMAKIDPYLRPLFDAMQDMFEAEKVAGFMEKGVVEVAPLAFMRGRAQPVATPVMTPTGPRAIGSLRVGDLVTGSNGEPTPVLGVFPQGRRPVFRLTTHDGSSTLCCAEHLWTVRTPEDKRRGTSRTLRTDEMVGRLRRAHQRRFELPTLTGPARLEPRTVPLDPYALGLLLGDGCLTTSTTSSFATADPELADALEASLDGIELKQVGRYEHVLRNVDGHRGGVIVANPVTAALRALGLAGSRSSTKHIPEAYLLNDADVRLALLQGLLDSDGGPVTQDGRSCRIQLTTCSPRLRDDVRWLVQSLGGTASVRTRPAAGRTPGRVRGREVHHRADAHVLEIRLPSDVAPFRLARKQERYEAAGGGGRPTRFIESIEPEGQAETVCIQVAAADSLYATDDFLVTHNTLNDSFVILDEAQNTTPEQMKMFLTRLGFGSKMVVTGDVTQVDLPREQQSGLVVVSEILEEVEGVEFVRFGGEDVVRHRLVQRIVEAYDSHASRAAPELRPADRRRA